MFLDNFMSIACISTVEEADKLIKELSVISDKFEIEFMLGISKQKSDLTKDLQDLVTIAL